MSCEGTLDRLGDRKRIIPAAWPRTYLAGFTVPTSDPEKAGTEAEGHSAVRRPPSENPE